MKKCPYCAEEIQDAAIKCRYCGERLDTKPTNGGSDEQLKRQQVFSQKDTKKCLNCGYERQPEDDRHGIIPLTECPKCRAIYGEIGMVIAKEQASPRPSTQQSNATTSPMEQPKENDNDRFLGGIHHPWRRYFARQVDYLTGGLIAYLLFCVVVGLFLGYLFPDKVDAASKVVDNQIIVCFLIATLWMPIEAVLFSTVGNTPGKWLFGISVRTTRGQILSFGQAWKRSWEVLLQGMGLGIPVVLLFTQYFSYKRLTKTGTTLWDTDTDCVATYKNWTTARATVCTGTVILLVIMLALLNLAGKKFISDSGFIPPDTANWVEAPASPAPEAPAPAAPAAPQAPAPEAPAVGSAEYWFDKANAILSKTPSIAIEYLNEAIRLKPDFAHAYSYRGVAYANLGQYQMAINSLDDAIRLDPINEHFHAIQGLNYIDLGNRDEGCRLLIRACELGTCAIYEKWKQKGYCP